MSRRETTSVRNIDVSFVVSAVCEEFGVDRASLDQNFLNSLKVAYNQRELLMAEEQILQEQYSVIARLGYRLSRSQDAGRFTVWARPDGSQIPVIFVGNNKSDTLWHEVRHLVDRAKRGERASEEYDRASDAMTVTSVSALLMMSGSATIYIGQLIEFCTNLVHEPNFNIPATLLFAGVAAFLASLYPTYLYYESDEERIARGETHELLSTN